jgi:hypothetical protein
LGDGLPDFGRAALLHDDLTDARGDDHDLLRRDAAPTVGALEKALADHGAQVADDLHADLLVLMGWERADDAVDGFGRIDRVQRAEHEVARLGGGDRRLDGFRIPHFTDEDHVGILAE